MVHLILTGATGRVGSGALDAMLAMPEITRISVLSRRPVPMLEARLKANDPLLTANPDRVKVVLHKDFLRYDDALLQNELRGASGVVWALGISQLQVTKEEYVVITKDYALAAAKAFQKIPPAAGADDAAKKEPFRFVYVSGEGASTHPGMFTARFGKVKGETELALAALTNESQEAAAAPAPLRPLLASSVRPAAVDPSKHAAILPYQPPDGFVLGVARKVLTPLFNVAFESAVSPTLPLGRFLAEMAMGKHDARISSNGPPPIPGLEKVGAFPILGNVAFRRLAGLDGKK